MDITQAYALATGAIAFTFLLTNLLFHLADFGRYVGKHLTFPYILNRHRLLGPWSWADVLFQLTYVSANVFCLSFRAVNISRAGFRAGTLSLVNLIPLWSGPHLSFLADLLGIRLSTYRHVHRSAGLAAFGLAIFHTLTAVATKASTSKVLLLHPFVITAASSLCLLVLLSCRALQKWPSYEIFLRTHQSLAILFAYSIWQHLPTDELFPRIYLYISVGLFGSTTILQGCTLLHRNGVLRHGRSRAVITHSCGTVKVSLHVSRPLKVEAGQYINLWMPSVSFWSFLQSHPFVVTSWSDTGQNTLDFFVQPRGGFTKELLRHARQGDRMEFCVVMFSGPHGRSLPVGRYEKVVMVADGAGIAAQLPYVKRLIHGYHSRQIVTRRIHLVWQIPEIGVGIAAQAFLNEALDEDKHENGRILQISIYADVNDISTVSFGTRATVYPGTADLEEILEAEMIHHHKGVTEEDLNWDSKTLVNVQSDQAQAKTTPPDGNMLVTVSGFTNTRDTLRDLVRKYLKENVDLEGTDFQPSEK